MERPTYLGDINKLGILADETIKLINNEPFLRYICDAVSVKMTNEQSIPVDTMRT